MPSQLWLDISLAMVILNQHLKVSKKQNCRWKLVVFPKFRFKSAILISAMSFKSCKWSIVYKSHPCQWFKCVNTNHDTAWCMAESYQPFRALPFGLFKIIFEHNGQNDTAKDLFQSILKNVHLGVLWVLLRKEIFSESSIKEWLLSYFGLG